MLDLTGSTSIPGRSVVNRPIPDESTFITDKVARQNKSQQSHPYQKNISQLGASFHVFQVLRMENRQCHQIKIHSISFDSTISVAFPWWLVKSCSFLNHGRLKPRSGQHSNFCTPLLKSRYFMSNLQSAPLDCQPHLYLALVPQHEANAPSWPWRKVNIYQHISICSASTGGNLQIYVRIVSWTRAVVHVACTFQLLLRIHMDNCILQ